MPITKYQVKYGLAHQRLTNIIFLEKLKCDDNTIYVFDKRYNDYMAFKHFAEKETGFLSRIQIMILLQ